MKYFTVDILTPSKIVAKNIPADSLLIPTSRGQINVLEDHTHLITKLSNGVLSVFGGADYGDRHFLVSEGVCKILQNKITILTNVSEEDKDVDVPRARLALEHAEGLLKHTEGLTFEEVEKIQHKAEMAQLRIQGGEFTRAR